MARRRWFPWALVSAGLCATAMVALTVPSDDPPAAQDGSDSSRAHTPPEANGPANERAVRNEWAERRRAESEGNLTIRQALRGPARIGAVAVPFDQFISAVAKDHGIPIVIDAAALAKSEVSLETPVTLRIAGITLRSALNLALEPLKLKAVIRDEALVVTTAGQAADLMEFRVYDVRHLIEADQYQGLMNALRTCIEPDSWDDNGGPGSCTSMSVAGALAVRQTQEVHDQIAVLLAELDRILNGSGNPALEPNPMRRLTEGKGLVTRTYDARIFTLKAGPGLKDGQTVRLQGPFGSEYSRFGTDRDILPEVRYDVYSVMDAVESGAEPDSWDTNGGPGTMEAFRGLLVVRQTEAAHEKVAEVLREFAVSRAKRDESPQPAAAAKDAPEEVIRIVYDLRGFSPSPAEVAKAIPDLVAPASWESSGGTGTLRAEASTLEIRQSRAVHKEINRFLHMFLVPPMPGLAAPAGR